LGKLILFLLIGFVIYWGLRKMGGAGDRASTPKPPQPETMVSCDYCGLHVPQKESIVEQGRYYCGEEHRRLDGSRQRD
jgi:uncharacterized protein